PGTTQRPGRREVTGLLPPGGAYSTYTRSSTSFSVTTLPFGSKRPSSQRILNSISAPPLPERFFSTVITDQSLKCSALAPPYIRWWRATMSDLVTGVSTTAGSEDSAVE